MQQDKTAHSTRSATLTSAELRLAEFEKRMNYKAKPLSEEEQDRFEAKLRAAYRMKRWPE